MFAWTQKEQDYYLLKIRNACHAELAKHLITVGYKAKRDRMLRKLSMTGVAVIL
jgi:hypothetical protein